MTPDTLLAPARLAGLPLLRSQSDHRLIDLVRAGQDPAFEAIVARYRAPLLRYCSRLLPESRAEDVVQQAFVRALAAMRRDDRPLELRPWLYRIAHNTALNALRDRALPSEALGDEVDGVERPDQAFERREDLRQVVEAVRALPERQRHALILRELEGRSYEEIALALGIGDGAVRQLLNRARNTLRAGASALTPMGLLLRLPAAGEPVTERIAELSAGAGAGAMAAKMAAAALVTGTVATGAAVVPFDQLERSGHGRADAAVSGAGQPGAPGPSEPRRSARPESARSSARPRASGGGAGSAPPSVAEGSSSRHYTQTDGGHSGSSPGDDRSGPGSGGSGSSDDSSGPDRSGSGTSGSGGDSGSSGSGSSGSGSSGSGSSDSGSSGSGSGSGDRLSSGDSSSGEG